MISEPQRSYLLELLTALGPAAESFVLAGAQAMKLILPGARATRDFDFVLDVVALRGIDFQLAATLAALGYKSDPKAQYFQFEKLIPSAAEVMRIEFMAPAEYQRKGNFRVLVQKRVHGRGCLGGTVVLAESDPFEISGPMPSGEPSRAVIRVARSHALLFMKCIAMRDRHLNARGRDPEDEREIACIHASDAVAIVKAEEASLDQFRLKFAGQFREDPSLRDETFRIIKEYFGGEDGLGLLLYQEQLTKNLEPSEAISRELRRARRLLGYLLP